jgi:opacity protein-like surface antigen
MLIAAASANAQFYKGFGIKAGTSIANQDKDFDPSNIVFAYTGVIKDYRYKTGLTIGIFKEIQIIENLNTQIGINYSQKGTIVEFDEYDVNYVNKTGNKNYIHKNFDFITAEIYAKYSSTNPFLRPYILAGLRLDFFLSQNIYTTKTGGDTTIPYSQEITNNKIFGASIGAGLEYQPSKLFTIFIEGTFNPDFTFLTDTKFIPNSSFFQNELKIRGRSFDIRTGIKF